MTSESGIGGATIVLASGEWPQNITLRFQYSKGVTSPGCRSPGNATWNQPNGIGNGNRREAMRTILEQVSIFLEWRSPDRPHAT